MIFCETCSKTFAKQHTKSLPKSEDGKYRFRPYFKMAAIETYKCQYIGYYFMYDHDFGVKTYVFRDKESNKTNSDYMRPIFYQKT